MKRMVILGGGESGVGAALLARQLGYEVFVSDRGQLQPAYRQELEAEAIPYEEGGHDEARILLAAEVVKSPGIPDTAPLIGKLLKSGIPVISEIEFAARHSRSKIIGITGTNGKTTTTRLTYHLLKEAGFSVAIGGNVGYSFARNVLQGDYDWQVLELSSFQLDGIVDFRPDIAMLLNITPDHLDRYDYQMEKYIAAKFRIAMNQTAADVLLYNADDTVISQELELLHLPVSLQAINSKYPTGGHLSAGDLDFDLRATVLWGRHNAMNARFAISAALALGVSAEQIQVALETFRNDPHRMELVATLDGVRYLNDSKATNVEATYYALEAVSAPVIWIAGGQDKGNDYRSLKDLVSEKVQALICLGVDNGPLLAAFGDILPGALVETRDMAAALTQARKMAEPGSTVLLSPACASFDLFDNYIDRGNQFKAVVQAIAAGT